MRDQTPADGRVTDSNGTDRNRPDRNQILGRVGVLPPLPIESAMPEFVVPERVSAATNAAQAPVPHGPTKNGATKNGLPGSGDAVSNVDVFQGYVDGLGDDVLEKATIELHRSINAAHAQFALQVRELERRNIPELDHRLTTAGWLKKHCQMSPAEASGAVKTARAMAHMPTVTHHALTGVVPPRSVQLLGQARDRYPVAFFDHEEVFGDIAGSLSVRDLRRAIGYWEQQVDYPEAIQRAEHQEKLRSLYLAELMDGMGDIKGTLSPELLQVVKTVIDAKVNPSFLDRDDTRTPAQRRADALGDICRFYLNHNQDVVTSGGEKPHVTVTVDYDILTGQVQRLPEINGAPVTPEAVRRIACDAGIIPIVLGADSEPLDVGRKTRTIPPAIRRAIEQRYNGCSWTGCGAPLSWCDMHHIIHWANGGETSLGNLRPYCRKHHTAIHNGDKPPPEP